MTIFNKFKYIFMDFMGKDFVVDDVMSHGTKLGIYHGRTTYKNALYRFEANGYVERALKGRGHTKSIWRILPALESAIDYKEYADVRREAVIAEQLKDKQVIYKSKYDQLTRDYVLIEPSKGRKIVETMAHSNDRFKSPRVYVGNLWEMMV